MTQLVAQTIEYRIANGTVAMNKHYYLPDQIIPNNDWADVTQGMQIRAAQFFNDMNPFWATNVEEIGGQVFEVDSDTAKETLRGDYTLIGNGTDVGSQQNNTDSVSVYFSRSLGGRKAQKRLGGFSEVNFDVNELLPAFQGFILLWAAQWALPWLDVNAEYEYTPVYYSRKFFTFDPLTGVVQVPDIMGTMNTRKAGRGI